jgi:hypothetical protein
MRRQWDLRNLQKICSIKSCELKLLEGKRDEKYVEVFGTFKGKVVGRYFGTSASLGSEAEWIHLNLGHIVESLQIKWPFLYEQNLSFTMICINSFSYSVYYRGIVYKQRLVTHKGV